jgi:hypothetical protein
MAFSRVFLGKYREEEKEQFSSRLKEQQLKKVSKQVLANYRKQSLEGGAGASFHGVRIFASRD